MAFPVKTGGLTADAVTMLLALGMVLKDDVMRSKGLRVTLTIMFFSLTAAAFSQTWYLDASKGKDSNPGTSSAPWKTVAKAQSVVEPGDKIILSNGSYDSLTPPNVIYADDPYVSLDDTDIDWIVWEAKPGHKPVFDSLYFEKSGNKYFLGYRLKGLKLTEITAKNMVALNVENCEIVGWGNDIATAHGGLQISESSNITVKNSEIHFIKENGVSISGSAYVTIENCDIYDIGSDHFTLRTEYRDCENIRIVGNIIRDTMQWNLSAHPDGIQFYASSGNDFKNCLIAGNKIYNMAVQGIFTSGIDGRFLDGVIENNLIYNCGNSSLNMANTNNLIFRNNTVFGYSAFSSSSTNLSVYNNIFYGSYILRDPHGPKYNDYNIYSQDYTDWLDGTEPHSYMYPKSQLSAMLSQLFTNAAANDYSLRYNCLAVDFCPLTPAGASNDMLGKTRSRYPDAGCYEYNGSIPSGNDGELPAEDNQDSIDAKTQRQIDKINQLINRMENRYQTIVDKLNSKIDSIAGSSMPDDRKTKLIERMESRIQRFENSYNAKIEKLEDKLSDVTP
ncbi:MAG: right-handed parallel beta-helix repeat-containing protein [Phycisphaerae bacterium]